MTSVKTIASLLVTLSACGGEVLSSSAASDSGADTSEDARGAIEASEVSLPDASDLDRCLSALMVGAPRAMLANCSTRDGRSRVVGPAAPRVTWTTTVASASGEGSFFGLAADASGDVYAVVGDQDEDFGSFVRIDGTGAVAWTTPFTPLPSSYSAPLLLASGAVEFLAVDAAARSAAIDEFDPSAGTESTKSLGGSVADAYGDPAVGADGSLYFLASPASGILADTTVSRFGPAGQVVWTSNGLRSLLPPNQGPGANLVLPSPLAIGVNGAVLLAVVVEAMDSPVESFVVALDPASGTKKWVAELNGEIWSGPAVGVDGSLRLVLGPGLVASGSSPAVELVVLDETGADTIVADLGHPATAELFALGADDTSFIATGSDLGAAFDTVVAVDASGQTKWSAPSPSLAHATLDGRGTLVMAMTSGLEGLDTKTGKPTWSLPSKEPVLDATLTSSGGIVGVTVAGTAFGASD
jgi:outer membrane protein assembly factor BamB